MAEELKPVLWLELDESATGLPYPPEMWWALCSSRIHYEQPAYRGKNPIFQLVAVPVGHVVVSAAELDSLRMDKVRLEAIEGNCWDVRYNSSSNADAGDSSIGIEIVGYYQGAPHIRVLGESYTENLRAAIDQAMTAEAYPPERPEYDDHGRPLRGLLSESAEPRALCQARDDARKPRDRLKAENDALRGALQAVQAEVDGNLRPLTRDLVNMVSGLKNGSHPNDIYEHCDEIERIIGAALEGDKP
ncbi:hypothetical protein KUC62_28205 [Pseudomonas aeruginosa]|nr:hypothetical protein [Pseudomonas aeruginosa]EKV3036619.1 hypothetical protein [Pseudomonas aeruginosa]EKV3075505.1 hypothetical protein [Pseudomonas aeruginosa]EKX0428606.1 hypothetical protein [Pseudomonas aeruginosa]EMB2823911.1 hypothetical protein [Pseudomonas aeruginosa]MCS8012031.1 hypothetical protein [Pseudomonas aeruginosa]